MYITNGVFTMLYKFNINLTDNDYFEFNKFGCANRITAKGR